MTGGSGPGGAPAPSLTVPKLLHAGIEKQTAHFLCAAPALSASTVGIQTMLMLILASPQKCGTPSL